jgi:hypothetical protein
MTILTPSQRGFEHSTRITLKFYNTCANRAKSLMYVHSRDAARTHNNRVDRLNAAALLMKSMKMFALRSRSFFLNQADSLEHSKLSRLSLSNLPSANAF